LADISDKSYLSDLFLKSIYA